MKKEYGCKCGKPASFFYRRVDDKYLLVYNEPCFWDRHPNDKAIKDFTFVCFKCGIKVLTLEKLLGNRTRLMRANRPIDGYDYVGSDEGEKEYLRISKKSEAKYGKRV